MNPELTRNLWIELTPRRLLWLPVTLGLVFLAVSLTADAPLQAMGRVARWLFYFLVVFWGTRTAAEAVVGEIRERTWDGQRLSVLHPSELLWGKLLGATSFQWFGGLICLALIVLARFEARGLAEALATLGYFLTVGLFAQSASMFASLVAVRRRASHTRLDVVLYQAVGLVTAWAAATLWDRSYVAQLVALTGPLGGRDTLLWHDLRIPAQAFYLASLVTFLGWSLLGNLTLLRSELQVRTGPLPWTAFVLFMIVYLTGFAPELGLTAAGMPSSQLIVALVVAAALSYAAILLEPKDPVLYRWLLAAASRGRFDRVIGGLQGWMVAFLILSALTAYFALTYERPRADLFGNLYFVKTEVLAAYFFVARDLGIFLFCNLAPRARYGDFAAAVALASLYLVLPTILTGVGLGEFLAFFIPNPEGSAKLSILAPAAEAAFVWIGVAGRLRGLTRPAGEAPAGAAR
jgi:hypothetical protein